VEGGGFVSHSVTFDFYVEPSTGGEQTWKVTADIVREYGRCWADVTDARPDGEAGGAYDVSDLEGALDDEGAGRNPDDVKQAALDAYAAQFSEESL
jgi:hypothetical protein